MEKEYEKIIKRLCKQYGIRVIRNFKSACGRACFDENWIKIPERFDTLDKFYVSLHEIGHIVEGESEKVYMSEYNAMQWGLNKMKELKMSIHCARERERRYFTKKLCQAKNRGSKIHELPDEIFKFSKLSKYWAKKSDKIYVYGKGKGWLIGLEIQYNKKVVVTPNTAYKTLIKKVELPDVFSLE